MQPPDGITLDSDYIIHNNYKFVNDPQSVSFFSLNSTDKNMQQSYTDNCKIQEVLYVFKKIFSSLR